MQIKEIKVELSKDTDKVIELLSYFGFHNFSELKGELRCATPDGDNPTSVSVKLNESLYCNVFSKNLSGDIFQIIQDVCKREFKDVMNIVNILFGYDSKSGNLVHSKSGLIIEDISKYKNEKIKKQTLDKMNVLYDEKILEKFILTPHADIYKEGISPLVAKMFNIGFDLKKSRIIFPHYDWKEFDKIVGIKGRIAEMTSEECKILGVPKYWNYIKGYHKTKNLYGWHLAKENVLKENKLIIFESEKSVLKQFTIERGNGYSVAVGGHDISDEQIKFIVNNTPLTCEIIIAFDKDVMMKDKINLMNLAKRIGKYRLTSYIFDPIPNNKLLGDHDAPIDKQPKIWNYLMSCRVQV